MVTVSLLNMPERFAVTDEQFAHAVLLRKWRGQSAQMCGERFYVYAVGERKKVYLHRLVAALEWGERAIDGKHIDHIDGNPLNNSINNLRIATISQNNAAIKHTAQNQVGYRGVFSARKKFRAGIGRKGQTNRTFSTAMEAALERDRAALALFGEFAILNFPEMRAALAAEGPTQEWWRRVVFP